MTELKPSEQYEVTPIVPGDNGQKPAEATIDESSRQAAMARAMLDNMKRQREQLCSAELDKAINGVLKKHNCTIKFMEIREVNPFNRTPSGDMEHIARIWLQPVALDEPMAQG